MKIESRPSGKDIGARQAQEIWRTQAN